MIDCVNVCRVSNFLQKFRNCLQKLKKYKRALSEIIFPHKFKNVIKGLNCIQIQMPLGTKKYTITPGYYSTIQMLVSKINDTFNPIEIIYDETEK